MAATDPILARGPVDRRRAPRRAEDVTLHYAVELLLAAALEVSDMTTLPPHPITDRLRDAADRYRLAATAAAVPLEVPR